MRPSGSWTALLLVAVASACGPKTSTEAAAAPKPAVEPAQQASTAPTEQAPPEAPEPEAPAPETPEPAPAPAPPTVREACERVCATLEAKCSPSVTRSCRLGCERYDEAPEPCHEVGREAFACWEGVETPLCANIVPDGCAKPFRLLSSCQSAPETFVHESPSVQAGPVGFERFAPAGESFVAMMPGEVDKTQEGPEVIWSAHADGIRYFVRKLPAAPEEFTARSQVRLAMQWLAPCTHRLKLHGQLDTDDGVSVHYDGGCEDGAERHGMIHMTPAAVFIIGTEGPSGNRGQFDAFAYGFKPHRKQ